MPRVLLTSFEPFGGFARNSSFEVCRAIASGMEGVELEWLVLPVVALECATRAWAAVERLAPDLVVLTGQATGAANVRLEDRGHNLDDFPMPDNAGNVLLKRKHVPGGPDHLRTRVAIERLVAELKRDGLPVEHSLSAGTFVCNHLYYGLLHRASHLPVSPPILFVHLPLLPEQVTRPLKLPGRPLGEMVEVVRRVVVAACAG